MTIAFTNNPRQGPLLALGKAAVYERGRLGYNPGLSETTAVIRSCPIVHPQP